MICDTSVTRVIVFSHGVHGRSGMPTSGVFFYYLIMFSENPLPRVYVICVRTCLSGSLVLWRTPSNQSLRPELFSFFSIVSFQRVDSWLTPTLFPLLATSFLGTNQVILLLTFHWKFRILTLAHVPVMAP